jgi:transcription elongation factor GreA
MGSAYNKQQKRDLIMSNIPMTVAGAEALREELNRLKTQNRPRIVAAIAEAREKGDLKENAEYHAAKEQQSFNEGRIQEIESKLGAAQIIDVKAIAPSGRVIFGSTVSLINLEDESNVVYQIVGEDEADIKLAKISIHSPIARALIGKELSDIAIVVAPNGEIEYEITAIDHL